jgi:hypothetical protein
MMPWLIVGYSVAVAVFLWGWSLLPLKEQPFDNE